MAKSILSNERVCYVSGRTDLLEKHHIFGGKADRPISDRHGFWVYLNHYWHNEPRCEQNLWQGGVHHNPKLREMLETKCQEKYEELHSHEEFIELMKENYL